MEEAGIGSNRNFLPHNADPRSINLSNQTNINNFLTNISHTPPNSLNTVRYQDNSESFFNTESDRFYDVDTFLRRERITFEDNHPLISRPDFRPLTELTLATHNINGLRTDHVKLSSILNWCQIHKVDLLALNETNCTERDINFKISPEHKNDFQFIWSSKDDAKSKGSGVAIIFNKTWAPYYYNHTIFSPYLIQVKFLFYGRELIVWAYYIPPNNQEITKEINKMIYGHHHLSLNNKSLNIW